MVALGVENAHNERPKIKTCWCIQINKVYLYVSLCVMAFYHSSRNKLTLGYYPTVAIVSRRLLNYDRP